MSVLTSVRSARLVVRRRVVEAVHGGPTEPREAVGGPGFVLETAAWFGLVTGLLEVAILLVRGAYHPASTLGALQMNRHFLWMVPVAHLTLFLLGSLPIVLFAIVRPEPARRLALFAMVALGSFALLLMARQIYPAASAALALGLAWRLAPRLASRARGFRKVVRWSLPVGFILVAVLGGFAFDRVVLAERRALAALPEAAPETPNVLLIVLDTVRADHLSLYGYDRETTPNLARLASRGVVFREARSAAPWTFPSHASLFTGRWPHELNIGVNRPLDATYPTLAEFLARHGYSTAGFVANTYFCNSWFGLGRGFAHYEDYYEQNLAVSPMEALRCTALGRRLIELAGTAYNVRAGSAVALKDAERVNRDFLEWLDRPRQAPFFAFLNYIDAHDPYQTPPGFDRHFGLQATTSEDFQTIHTWHLLDKKTATPRQRTLVRDAYDDCLAYLDEQLGRLFDDLERRGVLEKTLVVITSDHGEEFGEHGLFLHGQSLYRPEVHVPLVILGPSGIPLGGEVREAVSLRDLPSTIADRLGLAENSPFPGRSLSRFWEPNAGDGGNLADPVLSEITVTTKVSRNPNLPPALRGPLASVIADGHTYIRDAVGREELYDLDNDLAETNNLSGSMAGPVLDRFRNTLERLMKPMEPSTDDR